jgi:hypothetical protein
MATSRTSAKLPTPAPRPEFLDITRMIARRARTATGNHNLAVLVVDEDFGAAARFVPATNEIHIHHSVMERVNPREIRSVAELNAKHPEIMGAVWHELFHAMHSMNAKQMDSFQREHGPKVYGAVALLDEGRIEAIGFPMLSGIEQEALRAMVPEFVLRDVNPENEPDELVKSIKQGIRLIGLLAARADADILDLDNPRCAAIWNGTVMAMGEWFSPFFHVAQKFAAIRWATDTDAMKALADEWIEMETALIEKSKPKDKKPPEDTTCGQPGEPSDEESEPGEPGDDEQEGDDESEGDGEGQEEGEDEGSGDGAGEDEGDEEGGSEGGSDSGEDEGDESEGKGQDGEQDEDGESGASKANEDGGDEQSPSLGDYEGSTGEEEVDIEAIKQIVKELPEAAQDQREASGKRLKEQVWAMDRVIIADHEERRRKNQEASRLWQ